MSKEMDYKTDCRVTLTPGEMLDILVALGGSATRHLQEGREYSARADDELANRLRARWAGPMGKAKRNAEKELAMKHARALARSNEEAFGPVVQICYGSRQAA